VSETEYCGFCKQIESGKAEGVESRDRPVLRLTVGPEDEPYPYVHEDGTPKPTKSAECPDCGHTVFKVIGPKFDEPHEHNMLIVECCGCGFKGRMRWQGVARTSLKIKAPTPPDPSTPTLPGNSTRTVGSSRCLLLDTQRRPRSRILRALPRNRPWE
jgi:hypothetical protein